MYAHLSDEELCRFIAAEPNNADFAFEAAKRLERIVDAHSEIMQEVEVRIGDLEQRNDELQCEVDDLREELAKTRESA